MESNEATNDTPTNSTVISLPLKLVDKTWRAMKMKPVDQIREYSLEDLPLELLVPILDIYQDISTAIHLSRVSKKLYHTIKQSQEITRLLLEHEHEIPQFRIHKPAKRSREDEEFSPPNFYCFSMFIGWIWALSSFLVIVVRSALSGGIDVMGYIFLAFFLFAIFCFAIPTCLHISSNPNTYNPHFQEEVQTTVFGGNYAFAIVTTIRHPTPPLYFPCLCCVRDDTPTTSSKRIYFDQKKKSTSTWTIVLITQLQFLLIQRVKNYCALETWRDM